jgi:hypothetical protein
MIAVCGVAQRLIRTKDDFHLIRWCQSFVEMESSRECRVRLALLWIRGLSQARYDCGSSSMSLPHRV